jgi:hypothetical protein
MNYPYSTKGKGLSKKTRRSSGFNRRAQDPYNNSSPPPEDTMSGNTHRGRSSPPRGPQTFNFNSNRPGVGRRRDSSPPRARSPRARSPTRERPRDHDRQFDRFEDPDRGIYRPDYDRGSTRNFSPPRSAQLGGKSNDPHRRFSHISRKQYSLLHHWNYIHSFQTVTY